MPSKSTLVSTMAVVASLSASVGSAVAGDFSKLNVLGFSDDGAVFAFEEYGVQDGSGFPYANRFYIDTSTDQFLSGSPVRVRLDDETKTLDEARALAKTAGDAVFAESDLTDAYTAGFNELTEASADPFRMAVNPRPVVPPIDREIEFRLKERQFGSSGNCESFQETTIGFDLSMVGLEPGQSAKVLHEDASVPESRSCPTGYRIGGVHTFFPEGGNPVYAVTIAVRSFGFEGPDYSWLAVTTQDMAAAQP